MFQFCNKRPLEDVLGIAAKGVLVGREGAARGKLSPPAGGRERWGGRTVRRRSAVVVSAVSLLMVLLAGATSEARPALLDRLAPLIGTERAEAIAGRYIVVFKDAASSSSVNAARSRAGQLGGRVHHTYTAALKGFAASLSSAALTELRANPSVDYVEADGRVSIAATQSPTPSWGLDRVDQRNLPLNNAFTYNATGNGVKAYVIDTGLQFNHPDFGGRASSGFDAVSGGQATDCNGHGTHVGGTIGGTAYGIAKQVSLIGVRVLNCAGSGTISQIVAGINWVIQDHQSGQPAVANMSLGGGSNSSLDTATRNLVTDGVSVVVAAGNNTANSCSYSPARVAEAITVAASTQNDARASFSNGGPCVNIFAPGAGITSAWLNSGTNTISGTSMSSPHVAGVAAQYLQGNPGASPAQTAQVIYGKATPNKVSGASFQTCFLIIFCSTVNTPNNHLLYTDL